MWLETKKARNFNAVVWVLGEVNGYGRGLAAEWRNVAEMRRRKLLRVSGQAARRRDPAHRPGSQGRRHAQAGRRWGHGSAVHHPGRQDQVPSGNQPQPATGSSGSRTSTDVQAGGYASGAQGQQSGRSVGDSVEASPFQNLPGTFHRGRFLSGRRFPGSVLGRSWKIMGSPWKPNGSISKTKGSMNDLGKSMF